MLQHSALSSIGTPSVNPAGEGKPIRTGSGHGHQRDAAGRNDQLEATRAGGEALPGPGREGTVGPYGRSLDRDPSGAVQRGTGQTEEASGTSAV